MNKTYECIVTWNSKKLGPMRNVLFRIREHPHDVGTFTKKQAMDFPASPSAFTLAWIHGSHGGRHLIVYLERQT